MAAFEVVIERARADGTHVGIGLANAWHCTFEGPTPAARVLRWGERFYALGVRDIGLADTTGGARPDDVATLVASARAAWPEALLRVHLHDAGHGLDNARAAVDAGADGLDAALHGIGGSPFAGETGGNLDVMLLVEAGIAALDVEALQQAWRALAGWIGREDGDGA